MKCAVGVAERGRGVAPLRIAVLRRNKENLFYE
jgi:hypothetical protein